MSKKILIVDTLHSNINTLLPSIGWDFHIDATLTRQQILNILPSYQGVILRSKIVVDREFIDCGKNLKFIARAGSGLDQIDIEYARSKNIILINAPEGNKQAVAEHALGLLLSLFRKINDGNKEVRQQIWLREENRGLEIAGKTIGIIGYGNNGSMFAQLLSGFGCKILAYDAYKKDFSNHYVTESTLDDIQKKADIISFHIPLTVNTINLVNQDFINRFQKPFFLINTCRGKIVVLQDLIKNLESGKILGAALDVLPNEDFNKYNETENIEFEKLIQYSNVIFTPHIAGWTVESYQKINKVLADKIALIS